MLYHDQEKFDNLFAKFNLVGAKFTTDIQDSELDQIIADFDGEENY